MAQINKPNEYFDTLTWTGDNSTRNITDLNFQPDWTWIKHRSFAFDHRAFDSVRGASKSLATNTASAEASPTDELTAFLSNGFTLGNSDTVNGTGYGSGTFVGWSWKANGAGSANTDGTIASTVSASTTSGFSIVKYTGNGIDGATVGHGLGATPKIIMYRELTEARNWYVFTSVIDGTYDQLALNLTDAKVDRSITLPTSSLFSLSTSNEHNASSQDYIAYCFADVKGYSKFGSFVSNNTSDNAFIYTGFKPAFLIAKSTTSTNNWVMFDNKRNTFNAVDKKLYPDLSNAEDTEADWDFLSNGLKLRAAAGANTFIYMAFAENPLVGTNGVPATAR